MIQEVEVETRLEGLLDVRVMWLVFSLQASGWKSGFIHARVSQIKWSDIEIVVRGL